MRLHQVVAEFAVRQSGLVTRTQLRSAGVPGATTDKAVASGRLLRAARSVYRVPGAPTSPESQLHALVLGAGPGAVASHRSAAWLWDLGPRPEIHEVTTPRGRRRRAAGVVVHESGDLHLAGTGVRAGIPVTGVGRTILDCAALAGTDAQLLVDEARRRHRISRTLLPSVIVAHASNGRAGVPALRRVVLSEALPRSDFERLVQRWLPGAVGGEFTLAHRIVVDGFGPVEIDVAWPVQRVALELEGADHRDRRAVHDHDTARQNALVIAGWTVLRATYRRWVRDPAGLAAELRSLLERDPASATMPMA